ncbi:tetratricopeptide repeat protein [Agrobacterium vitis]|nr:tetratricopeptide repeat protein [Agrobacterium vitis]MCM2440309.1 tetratricopeptide repeat protein [Agrobacterium vitis]
MSDNLAAALALYASGNLADAYAALKSALAKDPAPGPKALLVMAQCCAKLDHFTEAAGLYRQAARILPDQALTLTTLADKMERSGIEKASALEIQRLETSRRAIRSGPFDVQSWRTYRTALRQTLNIDEMRMSDQAVRDRLNRQEETYYSLDSQTAHLSWCDDETLNSRWNNGLPAPGPASRDWRKPAGETLKLAYLLADGPSDDPLRRLTLSLAARHDRAAFEVLLICNEPPGQNELDAEMTALNLKDLCEDTALTALRAADIDILIDPIGHGDGGRPDLLRHRIAPLHLAMAGHPGARTGLICDYMLANNAVLPKEDLRLHGRAICHLPETFLVSSPIQQPPSLSRQHLGLPEDRVIFAAFHPTEQISPQTADLWRDILRQTENSLLWISCGNYARNNFSAWMKRQGIAENRLIFGNPARSMEQVRWMTLADIAIDCFPYNDGFSTLAAVQAGLPVPTFSGGNFASRVTASLLQACGLEKLIVRDADAYVTLCIDLARDKSAREALKQTIRTQGARSPLFDVNRFIHHLETAYHTMAARAATGLEPQDFSVPVL